MFDYAKENRHPRVKNGRNLHTLLSTIVESSGFVGVAWCKGLAQRLQTCGVTYEWCLARLGPVSLDFHIRPRLTSLPPTAL
jgi:hypothetical protein